jgi:hypothetical protein
MNPKIPSLKRRIRLMLLFFILSLIISGATAMPVQQEITWLLPQLNANGVIHALLSQVLYAVQQTQAKFPFLLYGYDWLAFAHFVIAVAFIGPLKNPVQNIWVLHFGLIACAMVIPFAMVLGAVRGLPLWWRLIDCSFGVVGALPLWYCLSLTKRLSKLQNEDKLNVVF